MNKRWLWVAVGVVGLVLGRGGVGLAALKVGTSILPVGDLIQRVGGEVVDVVVAVGPGRSPATYDPTPALVSALAKCKVFFRVGVPCEQRIVPRLVQLAPAIRVVDLRKGLELIRLPEGGVDPHIWLEPRLLAAMAQRISKVLGRLAPDKAGQFARNARRVEARLSRLQEWIARRLRPFRGRTMVVFHPSYGYFARAFGLKQLAIEHHGKAPSARWMARVRTLARRLGIRAIFVQPQFPSSAAEALARALGVKLVALDPLPRDCIEGLRTIARILSENL